MSATIGQRTGNGRGCVVGLATAFVVVFLLLLYVVKSYAWEKYPKFGGGTVTPADVLTVIQQDADTDDLPEGSISKYFTSARAAAAISCSVTGLTYNNTTGAFTLTSGYNIPTDNATVFWNTHAGRTDNPHSSTLSQLGIGTWSGSDNITTLGTIGSGTWHGTAIGDSYISSAATWNAKQSALTGGVDYARMNDNISGTSANVTGIVSVSHGGTGASDNQTAINYLTGVAGATEGWVLTKDSGDAKWKAPSAGGGINLDDLSDVVITAVSDNQTMMYHQSSGKWVNTSIGLGEGGYYTDIYARQAISETITGISYSNVSGILSLTSGYVIPTTTQESNWGTAYSHSLLASGNPHSVTKSQVGLGSVENTALSTWAGTSNVTTLGTIGSGTWNGTAIGDTYISSAATWNAKQNALTAGVDYARLSDNITGTASNVTGVVAIAKGGTGQTTAAAAFNALRPTTAKGDIVSDNGTATVILPVGTSGQFLTSDNTTASGLKWAAGGSVSAGELDGFSVLKDANSKVSVAPWIQDNLMLLAFYRAVDNSKTWYQMVDGAVDRFQDTSGVSLGQAVAYDSTNKKYSVQLTGNSYSSSNYSSGYSLYVGTTVVRGQCFTSVASGSLTSVQFYLKKTGLPTGNATVGLYLSTGVMGNSAYPTGSALSTGTLDIATLSTSYGMATTNMSAYSMTTGTEYCVKFDMTGTTSDAGKTVSMGYDGTSPASPGNCFADTTGSASADFIYTINQDLAAAALTSVAFTSMSTATTARLVLFEEDGSPAPTLNTDIFGWVSADNGANWTGITLVDEGFYSGTKRILSGTGTIAQTGTQMKWKVTGSNSKEFSLYGVGLTWK